MRKSVKSVSSACQKNPANPANPVNPENQGSEKNHKNHSNNNKNKVQTTMANYGHNVLFRSVMYLLVLELVNNSILKKKKYFADTKTIVIFAV